VIGTLVNGAGLAMNTVDNLEQRGLPPTNFLDTGGKATADTVAASMRAILDDQRVKALFVNIFGGLTKAEVIANGILKAYKEVGVKVPVVVRLRGTNEELGRKTLEDGAKEMGVGKIGDGEGPGMTAVEGFDEAVKILKKAVEGTETTT
jgi:succinyl-CoA synthetase alpha subunit